MKVEIRDIHETIRQWNVVNAKYQAVAEQRDIMNFREEGALREELELIESACVARHTLAPETKYAEARGIPELIEDWSGKELVNPLRNCDDEALTVLRARLSHHIAPAYKQLSATIFNLTEGETEKLGAQARNERESFLDNHVIPFLSEMFTQSICERLGEPHNIYVSANLRVFFITPLQMSIKQNYGEELERFDAETLIGNYRDAYASEMQALRNGKVDALRDRLYGRGLINPESISEGFCDALAKAFSNYWRENIVIVKEILGES